MPRTLFAKLALALTLLLFVIAAIYAAISISLGQHFQREVTQNLNRHLAADLIADRRLVEGGTLNQDAIRETFSYYMTVNPSIEIYLLDVQGRILSYSADPGKVKRKAISLAPIREFLEGGRFPLLGEDPRSHDRRKIFSAAPIPLPGEQQGYLYVVLRGEQYDSAEQFLRGNYLVQLSGSALGLSLLVGLLIGVLLLRGLTGRLERLASSMRRFRDSGFTEHLAYASDGTASDEIDQLGRTFSDMACRIQEQLGAIKRQDALRREMVANVSHDLRTPLATLHGYLETLKLKERDLEPAIRGEYLEKALHHSQRLTRLVEDLFQLATLDAKEIEPDLEAFSLADLVQDVVQKYQLQARSAGVSLTVASGEGLPLVCADISLMERVIENLVANALRHTGAGGSVTLSLGQDADTIELEVGDTGAGIAAEDLPHIFDRFYQAGNKHRGGNHAGLGLAIARHIVELHNGYIDVSSAPGEGARFKVHLPKRSQTGG